MVSAKFEFRYESLKGKFSLILFVYNLMIGYSKKIEKIVRENALDGEEKRPGLKFNPGLALIGLRSFVIRNRKLRSLSESGSI